MHLQMELLNKNIDFVTYLHYNYYANANYRKDKTDKIQRACARSR